MRARGGRLGRRLATVLLIDMVSSTERAADLGDRRWRDLLARYHQVVRRSLRAAGGREVDNAGDGFFAVFASPAAALHCAGALVDELHAEGIEIRCGLHMGELETAGAKVSGIAVHIGARVAAVAGPGQIVISGTVRDVLSGSDFGFEDLGSRVLKGVPGEWRLYAVSRTGIEAPSSSRDRRRLWLAAAAVIALAAAGGAVVLTELGARQPQSSTQTVSLVVGGLAHPVAVAFDPAGRLYVVESNRVRRLDANGAFTTVAGTGNAGYSGDGGPAEAAALNSPEAIAIDSAGDVYIADSGNDRLRMVDTKGTITTLVGPGQLTAPSGVAVGFGGTILVADTGGNRVRAVARDGTVTTIAGTGDPGYAGDGSAASSALLDKPTCLAVDANDNVFIADTENDRVRKVSVNGTITTVAGTDSRSYAGDGGPAVDATLNLATGPLSGGGCLAVDSAGDLFIADALNNRIREVGLDGRIATVAGNGQTGSSDNGRPALQAQLSLPLGVGFDPAGILYLVESDADRIARIA